MLRDRWLSPLELAPQTLASDAQVYREGIRASDKSFLSLSWRDYVALLRWTAQQRVKGMVASIPPKLQSIFAQLGIDGSMWRDLVWEYKRYFGKTMCAGRSESMVAGAQCQGKRFHHGQRRIRECFMAATS